MLIKLTPAQYRNLWVHVKNYEGFSSRVTLSNENNEYLLSIKDDPQTVAYIIKTVVEDLRRPGNSYVGLQQRLGSARSLESVANKILTPKHIMFEVHYRRSNDNEGIYTTKSIKDLDNFLDGLCLLDGTIDSVLRNGKKVSLEEIGSRQSSKRPKEEKPIEDEIEPRM